MKEMIYKTKQEYELLHEGEHNGFKFYVVSYGIHPCCYVQIPPNILDDVVENCPCHGGVTYNGGVINDFPEGRYIGWDYAHFGDYNAFVAQDEKKWTTEEMVAECVEVCDWLKEQLNVKEQQYNPKKWNDAKKVKPPKEGLYRVEFSILLGEYKECWLWKNDEWCTQFGKPIKDDGNPTLIGYLRFKPWEDEE